MVHQELVQDIFIRAVFGKRRSISALDEELPNPEPVQEPVRIIHKEQDSIAAFSLNQVYNKRLDIFKYIIVFLSTNVCVITYCSM